MEKSTAQGLDNIGQTLAQAFLFQGCYYLYIILAFIIFIMYLKDVLKFDLYKNSEKVGANNNEEK